LDKRGLAFRAYGCKEQERGEGEAISNMLAIPLRFSGEFPSVNKVFGMGKKGD